VFVEEDEPDLETAFKVVAIMQTITEDLDESGKRAWRKMLGIPPKSETSQARASENQPKQSKSEDE
jgi:hypothetical protein